MTKAANRRLKEQAVKYSTSPMLITDHPHIVRIKGARGGEPIVRGVGVSVRAIVEMTRLGDTPQQIAESFEPYLSLAQVYDALSYYYDHTGEIERYILQQREALKEAVELSREIDAQRKRRRRTARPKRAGKNGKRE